MRIRENEILAATAIAMYIVFFAMSPPEWIRNLLANPLGMAALFGGSVYVALYKSKLVGGLLIVAFVLSMTRVTEHLTVGNVTIADGETYKCAESGEHGIIEAGKLRAFGSREIGKSYDSAAWSGNVKVIPCAGAGSMRGATIRTPKAAAGAGPAAVVAPPTPSGPAVTPPSTPANENVPARPPITTPTAPALSAPALSAPALSAPALSAPPPTPPATAPPAPTVPVRPVMSCNLENFASF